MNAREEQRLAEKVDTLAGERAGPARMKAAVRLEDVRNLLDLRPKLKSAKAAGDPPTQAEFDALVDDVHAIHRMLKALHDGVQARVLP